MFLTNKHKLLFEKAAKVRFNERVINSLLTDFRHEDLILLGLMTKLNAAISDVFKLAQPSNYSSAELENRSKTIAFLMTLAFKIIKNQEQIAEKEFKLVKEAFMDSVWSQSVGR